VHRDIKLENIFLKGDKVKLGDFGCSRVVKKQLGQTYCGTVNTMAPEVIEGKKHGKEVDVYGLGVIFYQMVVGDFPFKVMGEKEDLLLRLIKRGELRYRPGVEVS
jgi:serine/threonine protein kinase